ncbi:hypothetical protein [Streptomyces mirabilis]|uniref:hypothetical protein n=1 Tax=Streptomyces mirabilis TaxID=68239 RepID=UPI00369C129B
MTGITGVTWHHDYVVNGVPYPLRNRLDWPHDEINDRMLGFTDEESRTSTAVHELGHGVVWLAAGVHVLYLGVGIGPGGQAACASVTQSPQERLARVIGTVAGERAVDRWLRETGRWTPEHAAMAELGAWQDRAYVFACDPQPRPGFGDGEIDYSVLHDLADQALSASWDNILAALPVLLRAGRMTGDQLAACTGLPNTPPRERHVNLRSELVAAQPSGTELRPRP